MRKVLAMRFRWCRVYPTLMGIKVAFVVIDMVVGSRLAMIITLRGVTIIDPGMEYLKNKINDGQYPFFFKRFLN